MLSISLQIQSWNCLVIRIVWNPVVVLFISLRLLRVGSEHGLRFLYSFVIFVSMDVAKNISFQSLQYSLRFLHPDIYSPSCRELLHLTLTTIYQKLLVILTCLTILHHLICRLYCMTSLMRKSLTIKMIPLLIVLKDKVRIRGHTQTTMLLQLSQQSSK